MKNRNSNSKMRKNNSRRIFNNKLLNNKLVNNKITLYIVAALALFSLYIHITKSHFSAVLLFFLTAGLVYTFTKNMTLVLGAAFIVTTIASMSKGLFGLKEGFNEGKDDDDNGKTASTKEGEGGNGGDAPVEDVDHGEHIPPVPHDTRRCRGGRCSGAGARRTGGPPKPVDQVCAMTLKLVLCLCACVCKCK